MSNNEKHIHIFKDTVVNPTCQENGYTLHKCDCGYEHKDNFVAKGQHDFILTESVDPSCTESGYKKFSCKICGETKEETLDKSGHDWDELNIDIYPTCTEDGKGFHTCKRCGFSEEQIIKAKGHKLSSPKKSQTEKGMIEYFCENCGETVSLPSTSKKILGLIKKYKKFIIAIACVIAIVLATIFYFIPLYHYNRAQKFLSASDYKNAYFHFRECKNFKDSEELLKNFTIRYSKLEYVGGYTYEYQYDTYGNEISESGTFDGTTETIKYKNTYDNGKMVMSTVYNQNDELVYTLKYEYDKNGNNTCLTCISENPSQSTFIIYNYKTVFKYDEKDRLICEEYYYDDDRIEEKYECKYNKDDIIIGTSTKRFNDDGTVVYESEFVSNNNGKKGYTKYTNYNIDGTKTVKELDVESKYNKHKQLISSIGYYENKNIAWEEKITYDDYGNIIEETFISYDENGEIRYDGTTKYYDYVYFYNEK